MEPINPWDNPDNEMIQKVGKLAKQLNLEPAVVQAVLREHHQMYIDYVNSLGKEQIT